MGTGYNSHTNAMLWFVFSWLLKTWKDLWEFWEFSLFKLCYVSTRLAGHSKRHSKKSVYNAPQGVQEKIQSPPFLVLLQNSKNDFMVEENDILEIRCCSFNFQANSINHDKAVRQSLTPLSFHSNTMYISNACQHSEQASETAIFSMRLWLLDKMTLKTSLHHRFYIVLEWNDVGVKFCHTTLTCMIGFGWN